MGDEEVPTKGLQGGCLCGAVQYVVEDDFKYAGYCHCSQCRKFSGSAFSALGGLDAGALRILRGADRVAEFPKSEESLMCFCSCCGSSLFSRKPKLGLVHLRLGTLDDAPGLLPQAHMFVGSKAPWHSIDDELPCFDTVPGPKA